MDMTASAIPSEGAAFLASGSSGNATLVHAAGRGVLIDCGISARECRRRIASAELDGIAIEALLLTHEHSDHLRGVRVMSRTLGIPVYATRGTLAVARADLADVPGCVEITHEAIFGAAGLRIMAIRTSHDAAEPVGFRIETPQGRVLGFASDTGVITPECAEGLAGCDLLAIEANHDVQMLEAGPYPLFLKRRILSERGHLSNVHAADAVRRLGCDRLHTIVGLHLSQHNNLPAIACDAVSDAVRQTGLGARVLTASAAHVLTCSLG
ncbi:MAG: MBL fold metallo-hydrolase [Actinomycetia bacterium]|nr:MBL fold metallo-hydrolase [Actinomycetes bacterium]